jgi:hypothetical protein
MKCRTCGETLHEEFRTEERYCPNEKACFICNHTAHPDYPQDDVLSVLKCFDCRFYFCEGCYLDHDCKRKEA